MADPLATAVQHHQGGRAKQAEALYRQVLAAEPDHPEALQLLGVLLLQGGDAAAAAPLIRRAAEIAPARADYHFNLALALTALGERDGAIAAYRAALARRPEDAEAHANLGRLLLAAGRPEDAVACFDRALRHHPGHGEALFGRGAAHAALARPAAAERDFRALLAAQPDHAAAVNRLGTVLIRQARLDEAIEVLGAGHARHPDNADLLANLASAYEARNDLDAAERAAAKARALRPEAAGPSILLARLDHRRGRLAEARRGLEAALARPLGDDQRCGALFELGQVLDKLGEPAAAYATFVEANARHRDGPAGRRFDGRRFLARVAANRAAFTRQGPSPARPPAAVPAAGRRPPVFFVGFPRSGTTLLERALAAHPDIVTIDEQSPLTPAIRQLVGGATPATLGRLDEGRLDEGRLGEARAAFWRRAERTLERTLERSAGPLAGRLLVDKLPLNLVDLGYAELLFPEARALVALRDPRDVCLSCLMQRFQLNDSMILFSSLEETVEAYVAVMGLWLAYRERLSLAWREVRYEDLVADFEGELRGVLGFLGLAWDQAVARYRDQATTRAVATPSYRQVTREIYRESIGRWRAYRDVLEPFQARLAPFVEAFGYAPE